MSQPVNPFRLNQLGYPQKAAKRFTYTGESLSNRFTLYFMQDGGLTEVYSGELVPHESDSVSPVPVKIGDFSAVEKPGVYRLKVEDECSRIFYIDDNVYDSACRMISEFFVWQRCGDPKGYGGMCHQTDHLIDKYGVEHKLCGGHHQSGDLRKWAFGCPAGVYGLSEYSMIKNPLWNNDNQLQYDIAHSVKYYLARQSREGYIFECSFVPEDYNAAKCHGKGFQDLGAFWKPFRYYDSPTDPLGEWFVLRLFISASQSLKGYDDALAQECLNGAERLWKWMQTDGRYVKDFDWIDYPPIGHDNFKSFVFDMFYPDSTAVLVNEIYCAAGLYRVTGDPSVKARAVEDLNKLSGLLVKGEDGALKYFSESAEKPEKPVYFATVNAPLALVLGLETFKDEPDAPVWQDCCEAVLKYYEKEDKNSYGIVTNNPGYYYSYTFVADHALTVQFLIKAADIFGRERTLPLAQRMLDFLIGYNPADVSEIEGVGYNQAQRALFGEFFPGQPQIPGGVFTDFTPTGQSFDNYGVEYDLPLAGGLLQALGAYSDFISK